MGCKGNAVMVSELSGAALEYWASRAEGIPAEGASKQCLDPLSIVKRQRYTLYPLDCVSSEGAAVRHAWIAEAQMNPDFHGLQRDEDLHVAIFRLRVAEAIAVGALCLAEDVV
jgi:hypothetical protein